MKKVFWDNPYQRSLSTKVAAVSGVWGDSLFRRQAAALLPAANKEHDARAQGNHQQDGRQDKPADKRGKRSQQQQKGGIGVARDRSFVWPEALPQQQYQAGQAKQDAAHQGKQRNERD